MPLDLTTTNVLLGIMAVVSVLEALAITGLFAALFVMARRVERRLVDFEARHIAPAAVRVAAILDDVHGVTSTVRKAAGGADTGVRAALAWLFARVAGRRHAA